MTQCCRATSGEEYRSSFLFARCVPLFYYFEGGRFFASQQPRLRLSLYTSRATTRFFARENASKSTLTPLYDLRARWCCCAALFRFFAASFYRRVSSSEPLATILVAHASHTRAFNGVSLSLSLSLFSSRRIGDFLFLAPAILTFKVTEHTSYISISEFLIRLTGNRHTHPFFSLIELRGGNCYAGNGYFRAQLFPK